MRLEILSNFERELVPTKESNDKVKIKESFG